jgi:6,7-dimethyl-8-ribityllumazine synthase
MIKWAHLTVRAKTEQDFDLLRKLLGAWGFDGREIEDYSHLRLQSFLPQVAALEVVYRKKPQEDADLELTISSDPDSAAEIAKGLNLNIVEDGSGPEPNQTVRHFRIALPGGTSIQVTGFRTTASEELSKLGVRGHLSARGRKFALVVSRFNSFITERLAAGALESLMLCGLDEPADIVRVPGAFEIPSAARTLALTKKYDAIICIGCLLRGDTAHYDVIANEVTRGIGQSAQETGVPHAFGVLTCDTLEQAIDRAGLKAGNKGFEAALAAVEMANLKKAISSQPSAVSEKGKRKPPSGPIKRGKATVQAISSQPSALSAKTSKRKRGSSMAQPNRPVRKK